MDKIIFPNGLQKILRIDFPNKEKLSFDELLQCEGCKGEMLANKVFEQHHNWAVLHPSMVFNPASIADFLNRECPLCHKVCRINVRSKEANDMDKEDFGEFEKNTAAKYLSISPGQVIELKLTGMKKVNKKGFKGEDVVAMQFKVLEEDGEKPLAEDKKWEVSQLALQRKFIEKVKELNISIDKVQEATFHVEVSRVGDGTATKYKMEFK